MNPRRIGGDLSIVARGYVRNPIALFFSLIFPIILILLFGLIFANTGSTTVTMYTQDFDHSPTSVAFLQALNETHVVQVQIVGASVGNLSTYLGQNGDSAGLVIPQGFGQNFTAHRPVKVVLYTNPEDASSAGTAAGALQGVISSFNLQAACGGNSSGNCTPVIGASSLNVGSQVYTYIDYLVPGLIGFSILTSPMFSMVDVTATYRKEGLFRQLSLTPLTRGEWLASRFIWYTMLTFASAALMLSIGSAVFGAHVTFSIWLVPFLIVGPLFFVSLGMLAGTVAKTPETAAVIGNVITFPMMFLAGTFFPVSSFSPGLQLVAKVLPLYYVIDGMNQVLLFNNLPRALGDLAVVLIGAVIVFGLAIYFFKWRDE
ncbi:MAG: ABC transporter permease [Thermoplasmata archaeon]